MTQSEINLYLNGLRKKLKNRGNYKKILMTTEWTKQAPTAAGVYVLIEKNDIIYVGESGNLRGRMKDLLDSRHHIVRRTIGERYYSQIKEFKMATNRLKFPKNIEGHVEKHITEKFCISYLVVPLGRKELEEYINNKIDPDKKLNKRGKRKTK